MAAGLGLAPAADASASARFAVKGDWGWGGAEQAAVTRRMCRQHARAPFAFVLTTGDNFYHPDGEATVDNWVRPERCLRSARVPWRAAWGNHDLGGSATADVLGARARWYRFRAGPATVVVLDGNRPDDPAQLRFLRGALARAAGTVPIVAFHQPVYTAGLHAGGAKQQRRWAPLFRRYRVALVLQGHNHQYERIRRGGVTYITTGGGGAPVYPCVRLLTSGLERCVPVHHFLAITVTPGALDVRAVGVRGQTIERVRLPGRGVSASGRTPRVATAAAHAVATRTVS